MGSGQSSSLLTFLLTDVAGSTKLWELHSGAMSVALARHDQIVEAAVTANRGLLVKSKGEGDSTFSVFEHPIDAVVASISAQRALSGEAWPDDLDIRVRMALHTGEAEMRDGDYFGPTVNRCARLRAIAHGGQTICSLATEQIVADDLPPSIAIRDLGSHGLRDLARGERVYQVSSSSDEEFPPLRSLSAFRNNLPTQRTSLVGRESEVLTVRKLLVDDRLVTLTGVGGCGKTRLALQVAAEELESFADGVFFCDLSSTSDPEIVVLQVASSVGVPLGGLTPSGRPVLDDLLDYLAYKHVLVVVDNCEHLIEASAQLVDCILDRCPDVKVIATSREALELDGERPHTVPSLKLPGDDSTYSEAVNLFCARAAAIKEDFVLNEQNAEHVAEICRRLDGIPLAIELAAAQVSVMTPHQIEQRLVDRFRLLSGGRLRVQRQQTLAGALDWSYDLLTESERTLLRRLAVFPGSFTIEQTEAIAMSRLAESAIALLGSLVAKSLVVTVELQDQDHRYRLLETVRLYAEEKLLEADESEEYRSRHRDYFLDWMESFDEERTLLDEATWDLHLGEKHNLRAAAVWSRLDGRLDVLARIVPPGMVTWMQQLDEGERLLSEGLQATNLTNDQRVRALAARAWNATLRLDFGVWLASCDEGMRLCPDRSGVWESSLHGLMSLYWGAQSFFSADDEIAARVAPLARRAMDLADSPTARLITSIWTGHAFGFLRDLDSSAAVLTEGLAGDVESWAESTGAISLSYLALVHHLRGEHQDALDAAQRATVGAEALARIEDSWGVAWSAPLGLALASVGQHSEGLAYMRELTSRSDLKAFPGLLHGVLTYLAVMAALRHDYERAVRVLGAASAGFRSPFDLLFVERYRALLQAEVSEPTFTSLWNEGLQMPNAEILMLALEEPSA